MSVDVDIATELEELQDFVAAVITEYREWPYSLYGKVGHFMPEFEKMRHRIDRIFQLASLEDN